MRSGWLSATAGSVMMCVKRHDPAVAAATRACMVTEAYILDTLNQRAARSCFDGRMACLGSRPTDVARAVGGNQAASRSAVSTALFSQVSVHRQPAQEKPTPKPAISERVPRRRRPLARNS